MAGFEDELKIEVAAQDSDLVALYELEVHGETDAIDENRANLLEDRSNREIAWLHDEIRQEYNLSEHDMKRAITRCVAQVTGVKLGKDFFREAA